MRAWLKNCRVTEIAMESTGQYWRPLWNLLEGEFTKLILVNPQHIKGLNGYKTDPKDAQWIADLLDSGQVEGQLGATTVDPRVAGSDTAQSEHIGGPEPGQEPHRAVVPERQYQSIECGDGSVWGVGAQDAESDCGEPA